jgi:Zn-dependent M28 family amino/carboxypeptidase
MNEENGLSGARAYAEAHKAELGRHVAALEADAGAGRPIGLAIAGGADAVAALKRLVAPLGRLGLDEVVAADEVGADLIPLMPAAVPVLGVMQDMSSYFDWHHTNADTFDKVDPLDLALDVAAFAAVTHALLDSSVRLPAAPAPPPKW